MREFFADDWEVKDLKRKKGFPCGHCEKKGEGTSPSGFLEGGGKRRGAEMHRKKGRNKKKTVGGLWFTWWFNGQKKCA